MGNPPPGPESFRAEAAAAAAAALVAADTLAGDDNALLLLLLLCVESDDFAILCGRVIGDPCGAGLAGMGEGTLLLLWRTDEAEVSVAIPPAEDVVVVAVVVITGRCSSADHPLLRLLAELLTGRTDNGLTTTSVESESMAAATEQP